MLSLQPHIQLASIDLVDLELDTPRAAKFFTLEKFLGGTSWTEGKGVASIIHALRRLRACHPLTQIESLSSPGGPLMKRFVRLYNRDPQVPGNRGGSVLLMVLVVVSLV